MALWSAGHSNRSAPELVALLAAASIACVADARGVELFHSPTREGQPVAPWIEWV